MEYPPLPYAVPSPHYPKLYPVLTQETQAWDSASALLMLGLKPEMGPSQHLKPKQLRFQGPNCCNMGLKPIQKWEPLGGIFNSA